MSSDAVADTPRIKICGVTREEDVRAAVENGASYLGFNFYEHSPRFLEIERARVLRAAVNEDVPKPNDLKGDIDKLSGWIDNIRQRRRK